MKKIKLIAIEKEEIRNQRFRVIPDCRPVLDVFPDFYQKVGFKKPWIGYFALNSENEVVGSAGFKGAPKNNSVEIAYGTFKRFEGQGIATEMCRQLVLLALATDHTIRITARTLPEKNFSTRILKRNNFVFSGEVEDEDDGIVWEWEFKGPVPAV